MKELYSCLEDGKLGLFESPTGTGKSMSLICGALTWLMAHEKLRKEELISAITVIDNKLKDCKKSSDDWFLVQTTQMQLNNTRQMLQANLDKILEYERQKERYKSIVESNKAVRTKAIGRAKQQSTKKPSNSSKTEVDSVVCDAEEDFILEETSLNLDSSDEEDVKESLFSNTKIFFCSRTHSQLTQFVNELKKSPYSQDISVVPISSRYFPV